MNGRKTTMSPKRLGTFGVIVGWVVLLLPIQSHALSLGGFEVKSALDEPLRGIIELESVEPEMRDSLTASLGSTEDFQRADVPRMEYLQALEFSVGAGPNGETLIEVTSQQPMKEPFLHFLVAVQWSSGKLVREYTGLLDPPLYAGQSAPRVEAPAVTAESSAPAADVTAAPSAEPSTSAGAAVAGGSGVAEYGPTRQGDTLWDIASRLDTGDVQANVYQVMIALQRQNPDAFIDNNVNRLKTGQILQLRDLSVIAQISPQQASAAYAAQLEQWQGQGERLASADDAAPSADDVAQTTSAAADEPVAVGESGADSAAAPSASGEAQPGEVLTIVQATADESGDSQSAGAGSDQAGELATMQTRIATLQESLESRNLENDELRERVRLLESQLENAQRLIEIESQEMAAAQQQAADTVQSGAGEAPQSAANEQTGSGQAAPATGQTEAAATPAAESDESQAVAQPDQVAAQPVTPVTEPDEATADRADTGTTATGGQESAADAAPSQTQPESQAAGAADVEQAAATPRSTQDAAGSALPWYARITDMLFSSWIWMAAAVLAILVLVLGLLMYLRRRQSIAEFEESILSGSALDDYSETTDSAATSASDTSFLSDFGTAGMGTMQADEVDPLAEAEVYLAYGRDEQAEEVLKEAARRDPERAEIKLKLLEIYKQRNDVRSFETTAEELYPAGDSGDRAVWRQVTAMGRELNPDNPLFQESEGSDDQEPAASDERLAPTPGGEDFAAPAANFEGQGGAQAGVMDFDLDEARPAEQATTPAYAEERDDGFSFDLDSSDLDLDTPAQAGSATTQRDDDTGLQFEDDFLERPTGNVDPATQPFPAPDQQTDLDRELERLAGERQANAASGGPATDAGESPVADPHAAASWDQAESGDADTLDFPASDPADIDFDLNLDDDSFEQLSAGNGTASGGTQEADTPETDLTLDDEGAGLLEFESENLPPQEDWAHSSNDRTPDPEHEVVSFPSEPEPSGAAAEYNEAQTKLDLARAYLDMGDKVGARSIIDEVMREGDPAQRDQATQLAAQL